MMQDIEPLPIYLDHNATTPVCDEAWDAMNALRRTSWANPSSAHPYGREAKFVVEDARKTIAASLGCRPSDRIIFTSGGTESNNLAIIGGALAVRKLDPTKNTLISDVFEHPAVDEVLTYLEHKEGFKIVRCAVCPDTGVIDVEKFTEEIKSHSVALVTVMHANNELGSVQPIARLAELTHKFCPKALFHSDCAQSIGKIEVNVQKLGVDMLSVCSHKFYGPKGAGALFVRGGVELERITFGANHELGTRPGTESILMDVGMAAALKVAITRQPEYAKHCSVCRDTLFNELQRRLQEKGFECQINGSLLTALPNTLNCAIRHVASNTYISSMRLMTDVDNVIALSTGSACHSKEESGPVFISAPLKAVGVDEDRAIGTLRLSTGWLNTEADMRRAAGIIARKSIAQISDW